MLKNRLRPETLFEQVGENPGRHTRFTADPLNIVEKRSRLDLRKNSYALRVAKDWNELSREAKTSRTVHTFKNAVRIPLFTGREVDGPTRYQSSCTGSLDVHEQLLMALQCLLEALESTQQVQVK